MTYSCEVPSCDSIAVRGLVDMTGLGWVIGGRAIGAIPSLIRRYPLRLALIVLLCLSGWLWWGKNRAIEQRDEARAALARQIEAYRAAHDIAVAAHTARKQAEDARLAALKEKTDAVAKANRLAALAAARNYAERMRCESKAGEGVAGRADLSGAATDAGRAEARRAAAELVAVSRADIEACTLNTANLQAAVDWARGVRGD